MKLNRRRLFGLIGLGALGAMAYRSDDLTDLFTAPPAGPSIPMHYRQGVIQEWDPSTLRNKVLVDRRVLIEDLSVLGVAEAASFRPGVTVGIAVVDSTWAILGRFVIPNTADATDAITQIGQRTLTDEIATMESTSSSTFTDLATVGPVVPNVLIPASGKVEVIISAEMARNAGAFTLGIVGVEVSGAASIAPSESKCLLFLVTATGGGGGFSGSRSLVFEGLPVGQLCTFTLKYRAESGITMDFWNRELIVKQL